MSWKLWKTNPTFSPRSWARRSSLSFPRSSPSIEDTAAASARRVRRGGRAASSCRSPTGPTMATKAPSGMEKLTSRSTAIRWSPDWYSFVNWRASSMRSHRVMGALLAGAMAISCTAHGRSEP